MNGLADYYAKRAPEYERIYQKAERQADLILLRESLAKTFAGRRVLEIACGTGWWTEMLARTATEILATDINEEVLAIARAKSIDTTKVSFIRANAFQLESIHGRFDAALAAFWWSHLTREQLGRFLSGLHRRLAPGSVVVFIDNIFIPGSSTPISRWDDEGNTYQLRKLDDGSTMEVLKNFPTEPQIADVLNGRADDLIFRRWNYYWSVCYRTAAQQNRASR